MSVRFLRFRYSPRVEATIRRSEPMRRVLDDRARLIARRAKDVAPVETGDYRDSIEGEVYMAQDGFRGRAIAKDWKSALIEFGTGGASPTPAYHPLQRGVFAAGLKFRPRGGP